MNSPPLDVLLQIQECNYTQNRDHDHVHVEHGFLIKLKTTLKIHLTDAHFTSFIILTSFPLLLLMIVFELFLERTITESMKILASPFLFLPKHMMPILQEMLNPTWEFYQGLIFTCLIYLFPLHLLKFIASYLTINMSSKSYKNDPKFTIINKERLRVSFVTSLCVLFLSTNFLFGFVFLVTGFYNFFPSLLLAIIIMPIFFISTMILFPRYLEMSTIFHLGMVISILEQIQGFEALVVASRISERGHNLKVGCNMMMVFIVWGLVLRIPGLIFEDGVIGIIGRSILLWMGELIMWLVFVVYYYYCKSKVLGFKIDKVDEKPCSDNTQ